MSFRAKHRARSASRKNGRSDHRSLFVFNVRLCKYIFGEHSFCRVDKWKVDCSSTTPTTQSMSSHTMLAASFFGAKKPFPCRRHSTSFSYLYVYADGKLRDSAKSGLKMINKKGLARSTNFSLSFSSSSLPLFSPGTRARPSFTFPTNCRYNSE